MRVARALSVHEFLDIYETRRSDYGWVDVRSEGEFSKASLPDFVNLPILKDDERHVVGLTYKEKGESEAIAIGHRLVDPERPERAASWARAASSAQAGEAILICWRGGLRSRIASEWACAEGARVRTAEGGFKAIRGELLKSSNALPEVLILAGLTGSGKTDLLQQLENPKIDLEALANHRGSSFGRKIRGTQPAQATFENLLFLEFRRIHRSGSSRVLLEDESSAIGSCFLPKELKQKMDVAPCLWVESSETERAERIYNEYIQEALDAGIPAHEVYESMLAALQRIQRKLGGLETSRIHGLLEEAFRESTERGFTAAFHTEWITRLLELYYDPMYRYAFERTKERKILFRGTHEECAQWLRSKSPS